MKKIIVGLLIILLVSPMVTEGICDELEISERFPSVKEVLNNDQNGGIFLATNDPTKLEPLIGVWDFYYTSTATFHNNLTLRTINCSGGQCFIHGINEYDYPISATYDDDGYYQLRDQNYQFQSSYTFNFVNANKVSGTNYVFDADTKQLLGIYPFTGDRIGSVSTTTTSTPQVTTTTTVPGVTTSTTTSMETTTSQPVTDSYSLSGHVTGDIFTGVSMNLTGANSRTLRTDSDGYYNFSNMAGGGYYTITPEHEGCEFEPQNRVVQDLTSDLSEMDFVSTRIQTTFCPSSLIYGEYSKETELLRSLRDNVLSKTNEGQKVIKLYYLWSPVIVRAMKQDEDFKDDIKELVDGFLEMIE